jgi:hypothetical protein
MMQPGSEPLDQGALHRGAVKIPEADDPAHDWTQAGRRSASFGKKMAQELNVVDNLSSAWHIRRGRLHACGLPGTEVENLECGW